MFIFRWCLTWHSCNSKKNHITVRDRNLTWVQDGIALVLEKQEKTQEGTISTPQGVCKQLWKNRNRERVKNKWHMRRARAESMSLSLRPYPFCFCYLSWLQSQTMQSLAMLYSWSLWEKTQILLSQAECYLQYCFYQCLNTVKAVTSGEIGPNISDVLNK